MFRAFPLKHINSLKMLFKLYYFILTLVCASALLKHSRAQTSVPSDVTQGTLPYC